MNDVEMIIVIIVYILMYAFVGFFWWWQNRKDTTYLLEPSNSGWRLLATIKTQIGTTELRYDKKTFKLASGGFIDRGKTIRHIDFTTGNTLTWKGDDDIIITPKELDNLVSGHFIGDLVRHIKPTTLQGLLTVLLPIICLIGGIVIGYYMGSQQTKIIIENLQQVSMAVLSL